MTYDCFSVFQGGAGEKAANNCRFFVVFMGCMVGELYDWRVECVNLSTLWAAVIARQARGSCRHRSMRHGNRRMHQTLSNSKAAYALMAQEQIQDFHRGKRWRA